MSHNRNRHFVLQRVIEMSPLIAVIFASGTAHADDTTIAAARANTHLPFVSTAVARPWTIRLDLGLPWPPSGIVSLSCGYTILGRLAIEHSIGVLGKGWGEAIILRPRLHLTPESSLFLGGGSSYTLLFGFSQRTVHVFADGEIGYEFRSGANAGVTFLVALGTFYHITTYEEPRSIDPYFSGIPGILPYGRIGFGWTG